jgi:hypothetical protein
VSQRRAFTCQSQNSSSLFPNKERPDSLVKSQGDLLRQRREGEAGRRKNKDELITKES